MLTQTPSTSTPAPVEDKSSRKGRIWRRVVAALLALSVLLLVGYTGVSFYIATQLQVGKRPPIYATPASLGLQYKDVTFPSRYDNLQIKGWFIPGILPNGQLTSQRTILLVHGIDNNRADPSAGLLNLSSDLAHHGFAVLAFDLRGNGESPAAPRSFGLYEQRDVLGAVDFLHSGALPYPELGRTHAIAAWGDSLGGATVIFAAANEPAIKAVVSDSSYADVLPRIERGVPAAGVPAMFTPGGLVVAQWLYGVDYYNIKPASVIASIAPRPILLIHGADDNKNHRTTPPADMYLLAAAALGAQNANVQTWMVPGATHIQAYHVEGQVYVDRIVAFYTAALGPDTSGS
ncbi:MAG TPA: alpha/beta hydrolase [Ktedonobacteraceae bacterium]|nr:alpha/beta hydrolase [Ktedonobacteraceae bacterium]